MFILMLSIHCKNLFLVSSFLELFETFDEREVESNKDVMVAVLTCYTWAILQFTLNTTATLRDNSSESDNNNNNNIDTERQRPYRKISRVGPNRKVSSDSCSLNSVATTLAQGRRLFENSNRVYLNF